MAFLKSARGVETVTDVGYHRCDPGLYLQVASGGTKSWLFRYKSPVTAKQREMGLGALSLVSLAVARDMALECRRQVLSGLDPLEEREKVKRARQLEQARSITFQEAAEQCIASKKPEWKNAKHAQQWANSLTTYAYPVFGNLSVSDLDTDLVLKAIEPIWISKAETASRVRQRIETVWYWARARKYVEGENPARLRGHLDKILAKTAKVKRVKHHAAVPYKQIATFIIKLRGRKGSSALAMEFMILTAARTGEVRGARWQEIDLTTKVWTIPADRMKAGREHRVPLCNRAMEILNSMKSNRNPDDFVFSGWKAGTGLSDGAMLALLRKMDVGPYTPHGFRSTFRDWAAEEAHQFSNETIELALAHTIRNKAEAAYRRGDQLERRRELMGAWSEYIG
ncbi:P4 family integrase [Octadecabacter arcticus 238]|uniref:p4 family integrase n=1 Tax=Octadecabacter arcticus 238 TaxID=391616 RepID=M9RKD3_9RHOB|nr:integrase arm-type DNA-binding domain-containing protein [Octadecabacter arcticus]AGI72657.1 P4 family integrase [Octadecabacter arcticus 238]